MSAGPFALLRQPPFLRLWLAGGLAGAMRWLETLAVGVWAFELTRSAMVVALMLVLRQIPMLLFGPLIGAAAERYSRRRLLLLGLGLQALVSGLLAALGWAGWLSPWMVGSGALVSGLYMASDMSVRRTMLGEVAGSERLGAAMGLDSATIHFTRMAGPLLGGVAFAYLGIGGAFTVAAACYLASLLLVLPLDDFPGRAGGAGLWRGLGEGLAYLRKHPTTVAVLLVTVANNFFGFPYISIVPVLGRTELMIGAALIGLLASADGLGAFIGSLTVAATEPKKGRHRLYVVGGSGFFVALLVASLSPWFGLAYAALVVGGLGISGFGTMQTTILLTTTPPALRTRIMGVLTMSIGMAPLGVLHAGLLADRFKASTAMLVMAIEGLIAVALTLAFFPGFRRRVLLG